MTKFVLFNIKNNNAAFFGSASIYDANFLEVHFYDAEGNMLNELPAPKSEYEKILERAIKRDVKMIKHLLLTFCDEKIHFNREGYFLQINPIKLGDEIICQ